MFIRNIVKQLCYGSSEKRGVKMFKFIHIGDVHLDTHFYSKKPALRKRLREGLRSAFQEVIQCCIQEKVNALLIAGDLFDNAQLSFQTEQLLIQQFQQLSQHEIQVFYSTGNHDPGHGEGRINTISWPQNVTVFKDDRIEAVTVVNNCNKPIARVMGVGHKNNREARNLVVNFPIKEGDLPHVGLVHTMVTNAKSLESHDRYLPCTKEDLEGKGYDYWALGHIHQFQKVSLAQSIYYSGNLQGRHPRETGQKGGLLVTINEGESPQVEFRPFSAVQWETLEIKGLENIAYYQQLLESLRFTIEEQIKAWGVSGNQLLLRVELQGRCPLKGELKQQENIQQLEEDLLYHCGLLDIEIRTEALRAVAAVEDIKDGNHVLKKVLDLVEEAYQNEGLLLSLLNLPLANRKPREEKEKIAYGKRLLQGLKEEAIERMVGEAYED